MGLAICAAAAETGVRPFDPTASPSRAHPNAWWTDFYWHRMMFKQSYNQWEIEDVWRLLLRFTRGRSEFTTPKHLIELRQIHRNATAYEALIRRAMVGDMRAVTLYYPSQQAQDQIYGELGLEFWEPRHILVCSGTPIDPRSFVETRAVLVEWPAQNPISRLWEMRQLQRLLVEVLYQISDVRHDLTAELTSRLGLEAVQALDPLIFKTTVADHRRDRGEPGDPRRAPKRHTFPKLHPEPGPADSPRTLPHEIIVKARLNHWTSGD